MADDAAAAGDELRQLEAEIAETLSEEDAAPLLAAAAVARYSDEYWTTQVALGSLSPWLGGFEPFSPPASAELANWIQADIAGAIAGVVIGKGRWGKFWGALIGAGVASAIEIIDGDE